MSAADHLGVLTGYAEAIRARHSGLSGPLLDKRGASCMVQLIAYPDDGTDDPSNECIFASGSKVGARAANVVVGARAGQPITADRL